MVCIHTENQNQGDFYPFVLLEISVLDESPLGHLRYLLTDLPPPPNSQPHNVFNPYRPQKDLKVKSWSFPPNSPSSTKYKANKYFRLSTALRLPLIPPPLF